MDQATTLSRYLLTALLLLFARLAARGKAQTLPMQGAPCPPTINNGRHCTANSMSVTAVSAEPVDIDDIMLDPLPEIAVYKTATPRFIRRDSGEITFEIEVFNESDRSDELTITRLTDDQFEDLAGLGNCVLGARLAAGRRYRCEFQQTLRGVPGDIHQNTVSATVSDDLGLEISDSDSARVLFVPAEEVHHWRSVCHPRAPASNVRSWHWSPRPLRPYRVRSNTFQIPSQPQAVQMTDHLLPPAPLPRCNLCTQVPRYPPRPSSRWSSAPCPTGCPPPAAMSLSRWR